MCMGEQINWVMYNALDAPLLAPLSPRSMIKPSNKLHVQPIVY